MQQRSVCFKKKTNEKRRETEKNETFAFLLVQWFPRYSLTPLDSQSLRNPLLLSMEKKEKKRRRFTTLFFTRGKNAHVYPCGRVCSIYTLRSLHSLPDSPIPKPCMPVVFLFEFFFENQFDRSSGSPASLSSLLRRSFAARQLLSPPPPPPPSNKRTFYCLTFARKLYPIKHPYMRRVFPSLYRRLRSPCQSLRFPPPPSFPRRSGS